IICGNVLWLTHANLIGCTNILLFVSLGLLIGHVTMIRHRLLSGKDVNMKPSLHWPVPQAAADIHPDDGPVLIEIEYIIDNTKSDEFEYAVQDLRNLRLRDGAINWSLFRDVENPSRYVETFVVESWAEHLRQHERITKTDKEIQDRVNTFHVGKTDPVVDHFIGTTIPKKDNIRKVK